jgi:hypothetical protein
MTMQVINVCWGTACQFVLQCKHSDANQPESHPGGWLRHYYPTTTGESCVDFDPLAVPRRRWGDGPELND